MANFLTNYPNRILTETGVMEIGSLTVRGGSYADNYSTGSFLNQEQFHSTYPYFDYSFKGIEIYSKLTEAQANPDTYIPIVKLKNASTLTVVYRSAFGSYILYIRDKNGNVLPNNLTISMAYLLVGASYTAKSCLVFFNMGNNGFRGISCLYSGLSGKTLMYAASWVTNLQASENFVNAFFTGAIVDIDDPYITDDNQTPPGGYGSFDYTSEDETPPSLPSLSAANAGFVTLWNPTISEVGNLADYLWGPTFSVATWQKLWNDPMECLLSLGIVPVAPTTGTRANIYFGNADTGIESAPITTQFVTADMGSLRIDGQSASYMDYAPYAKASIYLPYCGTYALDVDEIMDADLALEYHIDIYTGACVAYLTINNRTNSDGSTVHNVMYQFTGNCLASIPVTSGDHSQLLQSLLFMGASIAATVATAGAGAASGGAIEGLAAEGDVVASSGVLGAATAGSAINTVMSMKPNVMHSGNLSSTAGLLGGQKPFVTFTWSNLCRPDDEYKLVGMPLQKSGTLSDFEGYTIVSACHMDNILCTDAERSMIEQALGRGVII